MDSPAAKIEHHMTEAVSLQQAASYAAALREVESAWMIICMLPDSEFENEQLQWNREGIAELMKWLQAKVNTQANQAAAAAGRGSIIRPVPVVYERERTHWTY